MAPQVKDPASSLLCCRFIPFPGNFCMLAKKIRKKKTAVAISAVAAVPLKQGFVPRNLPGSKWTEKAHLILFMNQRHFNAL